MRNRYEITPERQAEFEQRDGEDDYGWISRQISMAKPFELVWLYLLRDDTQRRAMEMLVQYRAAWWTRFAAVVSSVIAVLATIVAIVAIVAD